MFEWRAGDPAWRRGLEKALADARPIPRARASPGGRGHLLAELPNGERWFLKRFPARQGGRRAARALGLSTGDREWRSLVAAHAAGVPVPAPRALVALRGGGLLLATDYLEGPLLAEWHPIDTAERREVLQGLADAVRRLHEAGLVHRDLHAGNVLVTDRGPVLLDLQAARRSRARAARWRDVGQLDHSLASTFSHGDRLRVVAGALGLALPLGRASRRELRGATRAAAAHARSHARSRTRRSLRSGRRFAELELGRWRGLRLREVEAGAIWWALAAHAEAEGATLLKLDGRCRVTAGRAGDRKVVVKEYLAGGPARRLADLFRGSPARRAWLAGHGLLARGIGAATPLAFAERRKLGMPVRSVAVFEDLRPAPTADTVPGDPEALAGALVRMLLALHRAGVRHGDLKASHVFVAPGADEGEPAETRLIDLEGVRFRRPLGDRQRIQALAELNASLPDALPNDVRERAFERYARALPFRMGERKALARIVARSLARQHRWTGGRT